MLVAPERTDIWALSNSVFLVRNGPKQMLPEGKSIYGKLCHLKLDNGNEWICAEAFSKPVKSLL